MTEKYADPREYKPPDEYRRGKRYEFKPVTEWILGREAPEPDEIIWQDEEEK